MQLFLVKEVWWEPWFALFLEKSTNVTLAPPTYLKLRVPLTVSLWQSLNNERTGTAFEAHRRLVCARRRANTTRTRCLIPFFSSFLQNVGAPRILIYCIIALTQDFVSVTLPTQMKVSITVSSLRQLVLLFSISHKPNFSKENGLQKDLYW